MIVSVSKCFAYCICSFCLFMDETGRIFEESDKSALFRKIDLDLDGKVSYSEFAEAVFGIQPSSTKRSISPRRNDYKKDAKNSPSYRQRYTDTCPSERMTTRISTRTRHPTDTDEEYKNYIETLRESRSPRKYVLETEEEFRTPKRSSKRESFNQDELDTEEFGRSFSSIKKSPLKAREEEEFIEILKTIIDNEKFLRSLKDELALRPDFNLFDAFRYFDAQGKGSFINSKQFEEGCNRLNIFPTKDEIFLFFRKNDTDFDGLLRFDDICSLLYPRNKEYLNELINREPKYITKDENKKVRKELQHFLTEILNRFFLRRLKNCLPKY